MKNETAWLIETDGPTYWTGGGEAFSNDPNKAIRFARAEDAQRVIDGGRAGSVLGNTSSRLCRAVEHMWLGGAGGE